MKSIIIAYPVRSTALQLKDVLTENGLYVSHLCATGASVLSIVSEMNEAVIVAASMLRDMSAGALRDCISPDFDMLVITRSGESIDDAVITLPLPLEREEFVFAAAQLVSSRRSRPAQQPERDGTLYLAKRILMQTEGISESAAHRRLQEMSMQSGRTLEALCREITDRGT